MTKERKEQLKKVGELVALALGVIALTAAVKAGGEYWLVPRRHFQQYVFQRDSSLAVWLVADSAVKADIARQLNELKLSNRPAPDR